MVLAIEVHSRFVDFKKAGLPSLVADGMCGGHFITGPSIDEWRSLDLREQEARLLCNGEERSAGRGAKRWAIHVSARVDGERGTEPRMAAASRRHHHHGRECTPIPVQAGDDLEAAFDGVGTVTVRSGMTRLGWIGTGVTGPDGGSYV